MAGRAAKGNRATKGEKAVKKVSESLPKRTTVARKGPMRERAKVAQNGPGRGVIKSRMENQAHIAALVDPTTLDEWDDEELARGYRKDKNGRFTGRPPVQVPYVVAMEMKRRAEQQMLINIAKLGPKAARTLEKVMNNADDDPRAAVAAAKLIFDRLAPAGRHDTVDHTVKAEPRFMAALEKGVRIVSDGEEDDIIDAVVIEDDVVAS